MVYKIIRLSILEHALFGEMSFTTNNSTETEKINMQHQLEFGQSKLNMNIVNILKPYQDRSHRNARNTNQIRCHSTMKTNWQRIMSLLTDHSHEGNVSISRARTTALIMNSLSSDVKRALPNKNTVARILRRHKQKSSMDAPLILPSLPTIPKLFHPLQVWKWHQPDRPHRLHPNKTRDTYRRMLSAVRNLIPDAEPDVILKDFEKSAMDSFQESFPNSTVSGCDFHLCQSVIPKINQIGLRDTYEHTHLPVSAVTDAFESLVGIMPNHPGINLFLTYFEHTYIRGRRLPG
ncbi:hypothetical protein RF11_05152 [Thelohanellus kitauei]|uniref:Uncharacterized protein n=1 Tax=Thelohanellus kitauei TaxID=669202 RepID=A0A0C2MJN5_THEKT|nr:hypothetical protein RF11_05152 [Thelohanellus kitauei]